ncbi:hypothetical protein Bca4012_055114 [Brassica carinata]|uniref:Uncharacterized protein n=1 Tax=Brassica carinata TaxID=52824 RepID=A0A8X7VXW1_BRACI|nr:hypothetical protein Bca52824_011901 [Brassica carinata]
MVRVRREDNRNRGCENTRNQSGKVEKETVRKKKDLRSLMKDDKKNTVMMNYDTNFTNSLQTSPRKLGL